MNPHNALLAKAQGHRISKLEIILAGAATLFVAGVWGYFFHLLTK